jgi:hypothetical protein
MPEIRLSASLDILTLHRKFAHRINPWLVGEKRKSIIMRDEEKALHFVFPRTLALLRRGLLP